MIGFMLILLVIYYSVIGSPPMPSARIVVFERELHPQTYFDKASHLLAYFVLMAWFAQIYHIKKQRIIYAISFIFMGVSLEVIQSFELIRKLEFMDMVANCSGVFIALLITKSRSFRVILLKIESYI